METAGDVKVKTFPTVFYRSDGYWDEALLLAQAFNQLSAQNGYRECYIVLEATQTEMKLAVINLEPEGV